MIPIVSISNFANAVISLAIAGRLFLAYREHRNDALWDFFLFYVFFGLNWVLAGTPGIITHTGTGAAATNLVAMIFMYLALAVVVQVPFLFLGRQSWGAVAMILVTVSGIIFVVSRLLNFQPSSPEVIGSFIFWRPIYVPWLRIMTGVVSAAVAIFCSATFLYLGWRDRATRVIYRRSMFMGSGMVVLLLSAVAAYGFGRAAAFGPIIVAAVLVMIGLLLILEGLLYEYRSKGKIESSGAQSGIRA